MTSSLSIYALDSTGTVVASGTSNNVATQTPVQNLTLHPGSYTIAIQLVSGSAPGHIQFSNFGDSPNLVVSSPFGNQGGTYYPSSVGHSTGADTIGVGAVPWWAATPYLGQNPLASEPFSSSGPGLRTLDAVATPSARSSC